jgi:hypothetical protein
MPFGDSVIDDIVRVTDDEIERLMQIFHERCQEIEGKSWQDKLDTLNKCNCCPRHKLNRPTTMQVWKELPINYNGHHMCICDCRHVTRHICRTICGSVDNN